MHGYGHFGFTRIRVRSLADSGGMTALVDIVMATIGILVIVFAVQEIIERKIERPATYDWVVVCDSNSKVAVYGRDGSVEDAEVDGLRVFLKRLAPQGGRFLIGVMRECSVADLNAISLIFRASETFEKGGSDAPRRWEIAPLGRDDNALGSLLSRWRRVQP